jgi:1,2-diacylglycerol 3-beta-galactosyltransferase
VFHYDSNKKSMLDTDLYYVMFMTTRHRMLSFFIEHLHKGLDLVISVHPLLNHIPYQVLEEIGDGKPVVPLVTVVTDLGSAHLSWFEPRVAQLYVPSDNLHKLAVEFNVPEDRLYKYGLPVREAFWGADTASQAQRREQLGLPTSDRLHVALVMGGGEGFGALDQIAIAIGHKMCETRHGQMVVVCGRNQHAQDILEAHSWPSPDFKPVILGFVNNVDEYMTAADCIVTKAGPGTIAEAMTRGLPCLLTSYLPGQEEGNVAFVTDGGVGEYVSDANPAAIAETLASWFSDEAKIKGMSERARKLGRGQAAIEIARQIFTALLQSDDSETSLYPS